MSQWRLIFAAISAASEISALLRKLICIVRSTKGSPPCRKIQNHKIIITTFQSWGRAFVFKFHWWTFTHACMCRNACLQWRLLEKLHGDILQSIRSNQYCQNKNLYECGFQNEKFESKQTLHLEIHAHKNKMFQTSMI